MSCLTCIYYADNCIGEESCTVLEDGECPEVLAIAAYEEKN